VVGRVVVATSTEDPSLPGDLGHEQASRDVETDVGVRGERLGTSDVGVVRAERSRREDNLAVGVDHTDTRAESVKPPKAVKRDASRVTQNDQMPKAARRAIEVAGAPVSADAVVDEQMPARDGDLDAIAVGNGNAVGDGDWVADNGLAFFWRSLGERVASSPIGRRSLAGRIGAHGG
jgi:hypothetical protein